jgi:hypothetical protein
VVDGSDVRRWFDVYVDVSAACGRGERDAEDLLAFFAVPLLVATDRGFVALTTDEQVLAAVQQLVESMRVPGYARSEIVEAKVTILNATAALYHGTFARQRADGSEITRLAATYLVTAGSAGRRISVVAVQPT